jgi:hypothetical protein
MEPAREANPRCTITRASRRLQKHATAAPFALSRERARDLGSCPRSFDFVRVAHFAPEEKTAAFVKWFAVRRSPRFSPGVSCRGSPRDLLRMTVSADRAGKSVVTFTINF